MTLWVWLWVLLLPHSPPTLQTLPVVAGVGAGWRGTLGASLSGIFSLKEGCRKLGGWGCLLSPVLTWSGRFIDRVNDSLVLPFTVLKNDLLVDCGPRYFVAKETGVFSVM